MKKWLIFAVIAAMFAMVMFPACGNKGGDGGSAADNVEVYQMLNKVVESGKYATGTTLLGYRVTWQGVPGYDYFVYYELKDPDGTIKVESSKAVKGQTLFKFESLLDSTTNIATIKVTDADDANSWSILVTDDADTAYSGTVVNDDHGGNAANELHTAWEGWFVSGSMVRVAVLPSLPGGFPMEEKTVKYSDWFDGVTVGNAVTDKVNTTP